MDLVLSFTYQQSSHTCEAFIDASDHPCYIFVLLHSKCLIEQFGEDISIKTDCDQVLPKKDDTPSLVTLRKAIFDAIKQAIDLSGTKRKLHLLQERKSRESFV